MTDIRSSGALAAYALIFVGMLACGVVLHLTGMDEPFVRGWHIIWDTFTYVLGGQR